MENLSALPKSPQMSKIIHMQGNKSANLNNHFSVFDLPQKADTLELGEPDIQANEKKGLNVPVLAFTILGTVIPLGIIKSIQNKNLDPKLKANIFKRINIFNIKYGLKEMISVSVGSIIGGLAGGLLTDKTGNKEEKNKKIKESIFQLVNIALPATSVSQLMKRAKNNNFLKAAAVFVGIGVSMPVGAMISNGINRLLFDKTGASDRKIALKDYLVHIDDVIGAFAFIPGLHNISKILPVIYTMCGYNAGTGGEHK